MSYPNLVNANEAPTTDTNSLRPRSGAAPRSPNTAGETPPTTLRAGLLLAIRT